MSSDLPFWKTKSLEEMNHTEWESLCDGCGKCCLNKIEDEDTNEIHFTNVACKLFDPKTCRCQNYDNRRKLVPECHHLTPKKVRRLVWLPSTCAYRLVAEGHDLPSWHHLMCGSKSMIHKVGASMKHRVISERHVKNLEDHVVDWLS